MPSSDQGVFQDRYKLIPRVLIFATRGDFILLIKGSPEKRLWANLYNGIGGHIERGESIIEAARREFLEETGMSLMNEKLAALVSIDTGENIGIGMFVFTGTCGEGTLVDTKEGKLEWHQISKLDSLPLVEDLPILIPKILLSNIQEAPLYAQYFYTADGKLKIKFN